MEMRFLNAKAALRTFVLKVSYYGGDLEDGRPADLVLEPAVR